MSATDWTHYSDNQIKEEIDKIETVHLEVLKRYKKSVRKQILIDQQKVYNLVGGMVKVVVTFNAGSEVQETVGVLNEALPVKDAPGYLRLVIGSGFYVYYRPGYYTEYSIEEIDQNLQKYGWRSV